MSLNNQIFQPNPQLPLSGVPSVTSSASSTIPATITAQSEDLPHALPERGLQFWLVFLAICVSTMLSALDVVSHDLL
jgi:hypothetical protein